MSELDDDAYERYLIESAKEVNRLYAEDIKYAFLSSMGGVAIMLSLLGGSVFGQYVALTLVAPCFVVSNLYAARMQILCDETFARILKRAEEE